MTKPLQYLTILVFILVSLCISRISYGQTLSVGAHDAKEIFGSINSYKVGYIAQQKFDTVKVRILYDLGGAVPACKTGYLVRQWFEYSNPWRGDCIGCSPDPPDRWFDTNVVLSEDKITAIDKSSIWQYHFSNTSRDTTVGFHVLDWKGPNISISH